MVLQDGGTIVVSWQGRVVDIQLGLLLWCRASSDVFW